MDDEPDVHLCGATATPNPFFTKNRVTHHRFVASGIMLIKPSPIRFDNQFPLKEDYDHTLQHLGMFGKVLRCEDVFFMYSKTKVKGGCVEFRTPELEAIVVARLKAKWGPELIRPNKRDPEHEVVLNWKS